MLLLCRLCLCLHGRDGLDSSHSLSRRIVIALSEGTTLLVHNIALAESTDELEDGFAFEKGELHVALTSSMAGSDNFVGVDVDDARFLGVSPA